MHLAALAHSSSWCARVLLEVGTFVNTHDNSSCQCQTPQHEHQQLLSFFAAQKKSLLEICRFVLPRQHQLLDVSAGHGAVNLSQSAVNATTQPTTHLSKEISLPNSSSSPTGFSLHFPFSSLTFNDTIASPIPFTITLSTILSLAPCLSSFCLYSSWLTERCLFSLWVPFLPSSCPGPLFSDVLLSPRAKIGTVLERCAYLSRKGVACFQNAVFLGLRHLKHMYCIESGVHLTPLYGPTLSSFLTV